MDQPLSAFLAKRLRGRAIALDFGSSSPRSPRSQSASPTGIAATLLAAPPSVAPSPRQALVTLFSGAAGWATAVGVLRGRFHPEVHAVRIATARQEP